MTEGEQSQYRTQILNPWGGGVCGGGGVIISPSMVLNQRYYPCVCDIEINIVRNKQENSQSMQLYFYKFLSEYLLLIFRYLIKLNSNSSPTKKKRLNIS
jgi:hypothetical protein